MSATPEVIRFDLKLGRQNVELNDPNTGQVKLYYLQELDGTERDAYLNTVSSRIVVGKDGKSTVRNFDKFQTNLIAKSLYSAETETLVPAADIQKFPARVVSALFKLAQDLSGLDLEKGKDKDEDDEKND